MLLSYLPPPNILTAILPPYYYYYYPTPYFTIAILPYPYFYQCHPTPLNQPTPFKFFLLFAAKPYPQNFPTPFNFPFIPNLPLLNSFPKLPYPLTHKNAPELLTPMLSFLPTHLLFFSFFYPLSKAAPIIYKKLF